jgi:hypothetical protein
MPDPSSDRGFGGIFTEVVENGMGVYRWFGARPGAEQLHGGRHQGPARGMGSGRNARIRGATSEPGDVDSPLARPLRDGAMPGGIEWDRGRGCILENSVS